MKKIILFVLTICIFVLFLTGCDEQVNQQISPSVTTTSSPNKEYIVSDEMRGYATVVLRTANELLNNNITPEDAYILLDEINKHKPENKPEHGDILVSVICSTIQINLITPYIEGTPLDESEVKELTKTRDDLAEILGEK